MSFTFIMIGSRLTVLAILVEKMEVISLHYIHAYLDFYILLRGKNIKNNKHCRYLKVSIQNLYHYESHFLVLCINISTLCYYSVVCSFTATFEYDGLLNFW